MASWIPPLRPLLLLLLLPHPLLDPHRLRWVVHVLWVDWGLLVPLLLLLLGVHNHIILEDEAEVDRRVVGPVKSKGRVEE